jgi:MarR-like DNA-binding transcriptional regulator SgrR of sgrS sRNA
VLSVSLKEKDGLLVSLVSWIDDEQPISRLHFFPRETIAWNPQADFAEPQFPDYDAFVTFLQSTARESIRPDWHHPYPPFIWFNVFENLCVQGDDGKFKNVLASQIRPDSTRRVWEISLRKDIHFADGSLLMAKDIRASWERTWRACKENHCSSQWLWRSILGANDFAEGKSPNVAGLQIIDDYTFKVVLNESRPNFGDHLVQACFSIVKQESEKKSLIGTGAFKPVARHTDPGVSITFERNPYYHGGQALLQELRLASYKSDVVEVFPNYRAAIATIRQKNDVEYFQQIEANEVRPLPAPTIYFLAINPSVRALSDVARRRCVASALDREVLATIIDNAECAVKTDFFVNIDKDDTTSQTSASLKFNRALNIAFLARDEVARAISERLAVRLAHLKIPHHSPKAMPLASFEQLRRRGKYEVLIDSYTPSFDSPLCNLAQLVNRGYVVDSMTVSAVENALASRTEEYPAVLEERLIAEAVLFPVVSAQDYVITPSELMETRLIGPKHIDFSRAWLPRKRRALQQSKK